MQFDEEIFFRAIANEGELLTNQQVEACLEFQRHSPHQTSLFGIMIEQGYINDKNMAAILAKTPPHIQQPSSSEPSKKVEKKFGELCVEKGHVTAAQVAECLTLQNRLDQEGKHLRLGQILIEKKYMTIRQAQAILELQGKKILRCPRCETKFNIRHYKPEKKYQCPKCSTELVSSQASNVNVDRSLMTREPVESMNVERSFSARDSVDVDDEALSLLHKKIGDYEIVELIGEGGMADVYKVSSPYHKRARALKVMKSQATVQRFNREFESAHALRHPNIVRVYETGKIETRPYFFMEYMDGGTLAKHVERMGVIPVKEAVSILKQVAMGLKYAHENSVIHRDIKTTNILLTRSSHRDLIAKITDFGIARSPSNNQITVAGQLVGTFKYMSPEHIKGENLDGRTDIFSLGIVAYEMLTGREPFNVDSPVGYLFVNIKETPQLLHQINPDIPKTLSLIVLQMLAKDPKDRYDASALLRDLDRWSKHQEEGTKLFELEDSTSVFYDKGPLAAIKGLWNRLFVRNPVEPGSEIRPNIEAMKTMMETEEVNRDSAAQKQYEFAQELLQQNNISGAKRYLKALVEVFPASPWAARAKRKLQKLEESGSVEPDSPAAKKK